MEEQAFVREISMPIYQSKGWMKLLGVVMIVYGALIAITVIGIVVAWLPIWIGVLLFQAATRAETAQLTGQKQALIESLDKIKLYFVIHGVLMLIALVAMGIALLVTGGAILSLMNNY